MGFVFKFVTGFLIKQFQVWPSAKLQNWMTIPGAVVSWLLLLDCFFFFSGICLNIEHGVCSNLLLIFSYFQESVCVSWPMHIHA